MTIYVAPHGVVSKPEARLYENAKTHITAKDKYEPRVHKTEHYNNVATGFMDWDMVGMSSLDGNPSERSNGAGASDGTDGKVPLAYSLEYGLQAI